MSDTRAVRQIVHDHLGDRGDCVNHHGITVKQMEVPKRQRADGF